MSELLDRDTAITPEAVAMVDGIITTHPFDGVVDSALATTVDLDTRLVDEQDLEERFSEARLHELCDDYLENGTGVNLKEMLNGRQFVVAYIDATGKYGDIGRSVETQVFAKHFAKPESETPLLDIADDYGKYDEGSIFACVIDASGDVIRPAGALRIIEHKEGLGFKDVNDLVIDDSDLEIEESEKNPWLGEIKAAYFEDGEAYDPAVAWQRLGERNGVELSLPDSLDIATHASGEAYSGAHGDIDGVSMLFYHACLRYALAHNKENLLAIFDLKPFANLQQFGGPFDTYKGLQPHPYGGPGDTMPAFCKLEKGVQRIRDNDAFVGSIFIDGFSLNDTALLPNEYQPELYANEAVGLDPLVS